MDPATALLDQLRELARGARDDANLAAALTALVTSLRAAVPAYRDLQLTVVQDGYPVVLTTGDGRRFVPAAATSLRLPLAAITADCETGSQIVFYATAPGAFVALAVELHRALGGATPEISLDDDLPPSDHPVGLSGGTELADINRAVGVLIDRGTPPGDAHEALRDQAISAGVQPHTYALEVVRDAGSPDSRPDDTDG